MAVWTGPGVKYTQATSRCRIQLELETPLGKALIEENGYSGQLLLLCLITYIHVGSLTKSITQHKTFLNQPEGMSEQIMFIVAYVIKGTTINKIRALIMNRSDVLKRTS